MMRSLRRWKTGPQDGVPANPRAWLVSTGRFKAIDTLRRRARFDGSQEKIAEQFESASQDSSPETDEALADDQMRLVFTCCHPALAPEARVALTLREVCGLTTEGDRPRISHDGVHAGATDCASQGKDS